MKKAIFSIAVFVCNVWYSNASAQASVFVKIGTPVYCQPPARVIVVAPPPQPKVIVVKPAPVIVVPVRKRVVVQPPVYVVARPKRKIIIFI